MSHLVSVSAVARQKHKPGGWGDMFLVGIVGRIMGHDCTSDEGLPYHIQNQSNYIFHKITKSRILPRIFVFATQDLM